LARKFLYAIVIAVVLVIATLLGLRFWAKELSEYAFVPVSRFSAPAKLPADAYDKPQMWISAGKPGAKVAGADDPARWLPRGATPAPAPVKAAVFFVHPTSHFDHHRWNAALDDNLTNQRSELMVRGLASPFGAAEEVWAPRYRQATFGAFLTSKPAGAQAIDIAYKDVKSAFDHFLSATDPATPIVLVGHSQGALLLARLLHERAAGKPLAKRIAAAYLVGWPISLADDLPLLGLAACATPDQAGCILSWQSFAEPADPKMMFDTYAHLPGFDGRKGRVGPFLCTNPITGKSADTAPASQNLGTLVPDANLSGGALVAGMVSARCDPRGLLMIGSPPQLGPFALPGNNYHLYDIPLFWANIRADFARRVGAWHKAQGG